MWEDRAALSELQLDTRSRILDVGCGSGELTRVLAEEATGEIIGVDIERDLLAEIETADVVQGDARQLPFRDGSFDLVVCQALLVNMPDPVPVLREFIRLSRDLVAVIEPDNSQVQVESSVTQETILAQQARDAYTTGIPTDITLGSSARELLTEVGLQNVTSTRYDFERRTTHPYSENDIESARLKRNASRIHDHKHVFLDGTMTPEEYTEFRAQWREMGRSVLKQMTTGEYEREETIPFYVTVGEVT